MPLFKFLYTNSWGIFLGLFLGFQTHAQQPNILLITADDLGFDDLSMHKHPVIDTPNIDALAKQSVQFSDFTVTPVCSTTRAALLTGRDFYKTGVSGVHGGRDFLHLSETLLSEVLVDNGYKTGTWGKWHLGKTQSYMPHDRGFEEAYYAELYHHKNSIGFLNGKPVQHQDWVSKVIADYTIDFIEKHKANPFFAYASFLAPHEPWLAPKKYTDKFIQLGYRPAIANLYGMIEEMDAQIGRLLKALAEQKLADNTIVIFMSDNGPWWDSSNFGAMTKSEWHARNPSKLNGNKGQSWQNGVKSPLFMRYQGHWQPQTISRYVDVKDIFPTLLDISKITLSDIHKPLDGITFKAYLEGNTQGVNPRETYIASHDVVSNAKHFNQWTPIDDEVRKGMVFSQQLIGLRTEKYKLLLNAASDQMHYPKSVDNLMLFDMQKDPLETRNIINEQPDIALKMHDKLATKFMKLLHDKDSYRVPVYTVGGTSDVSVVNGFGPSKTFGNVISKAHHLSGLKATGDGADYKINVITANTYDVYLKQDNTNGSGISIRLGVQPVKSSGKHAIKSQLTGELLQKIGTLNLSKGEQILRFEVIGNQSQKHWAEISALRRLILVPKNFSLSPQHLIMPN